MGMDDAGVSSLNLYWNLFFVAPGTGRCGQTLADGTESFRCGCSDGRRSSSSAEVACALESAIMSTVLNRSNIVSGRRAGMFSAPRHTCVALNAWRVRRFSVTTDTLQALRCPQCGQIDQVRKASAIVAQGTELQQLSGSTSSIGAIGGESGGVVVSGGKVALTGVSATELSHRLASPAPFAEPSRGYRYHLEGVFFNLGVAFAVIALGLRVMGRRQDWIIIALIVAGAFYILSWILKKRWQSIGEPRYQQELQSRRNAWKEAYAEWDSLYYCGRCDRPFPVVLT
jgi:hypothetical protein